MKKSFLLFAILLLINSIANAQDTLTILHLNDTHSTLSAIGPRNELLQGTQGGIARAATVIGITKMTDPNVLILHAGDYSIGDLFYNTYFGVPELQILKSLGLDAMTIGNHEWDLTPSALYASLQASFNPGEGFPLLSANTILDDPEVQYLKDYILPYTVKQIGNIKVGIFGLTTPEANITSLPSPAVIDTNIFEIATKMVDSLTSQNCDLIILLSHLGLFLDQAIATNVPGINVIVGGHDHYLLETPVSPIDPLGGTNWIVQAGSNYQYIGKLQLIINEGDVSFLNYETIRLDESIPDEPSVASTVNDLIDGIEELYGPVYSQQIGFATDYFGEVADSLMYLGNHDTPVGNIVTDAFRLKTGTDIAIEAGGSTAQPIYKGPLVAADAFRVVGYGFNEVNGLGFRLVTFDILGSDLLVALETCLATIESGDEFFPQVSGMRYAYDPNLNSGSRLISVTINNNPIDPAATYSVTGNELLAQLLTGYFQIPISNFFLYDSLSEFQVLSEFIAAQQNISPEMEGHIVATRQTSVDKDNDLLAHSYELNQNYPNPFNPVTNFKFRIASFELVSLKVFDILGKEVATIVNEELPAGVYKYKWDATGMASGVYLYKLQAGSFVETKKMILLK